MLAAAVQLSQNEKLLEAQPRHRVGVLAAAVPLSSQNETFLLTCSTLPVLTTLLLLLPQTDEFAVRADEALISWVAKQRTHFAELLSPPAAAAVAALLEGKPAAAAAAAAPGSSSGRDASRSNGASLADRKGMLQVVRQLAAVVQPDK